MITSGVRPARVVQALRMMAWALVALLMAAFLVQAGSSFADTAPPDPNNPATPPTVSTDVLPTVQVNGVVWQQVIIGDIVYAAGSFSTARPAGSPSGTNTVSRRNLLAFRLSTGALISSFAPTLNAQALTIAASPDGSRLYVGGEFTSITVNGVTSSRLRVAALDPATGAVLPGFSPAVGARVRTVVATADTVYFGGDFTNVGSSGRSRLAAVRASDGALLPWTPAANATVYALALAPDNASLVVGGRFTTLNGSSRPGYGLGRVTASSGSSLAFPANEVVRNAGTDAAILSLSTDGTRVYGTGYIFGTGGNLEGAFAARWSDGGIHWIEDCHGDTYSVWASPRAVYTAGHAHYCGNLGGYPETNPRTWHRAIAFSLAATGTLTADPYGYPSFTGRPAPSLLNWFPDMDTGTYTGQYQGPWTVTGTADYVVMGGEFRNVNGIPQQGLVRFAVSSIAPDRDGPRVSGSAANPTPTYLDPGRVRVNWQSNWDRDNSLLSYQVIRDGNTATPAFARDQLSTFWNRPTLSWTDSGLSAGTHTYRIFARDPWGNLAASNTVSVNVPVGGTSSNAPPVASFTVTTSGLSASVNASGSTDGDGVITSYAWDFGDNATASGVTSAHTYATAGTYTIRLTVTDDDGASASTTRSVTVGSTSGQTVAQDSFSRTVSSGFGSAEVGGAWALNGSASAFSVGNGVGTVSVGAGTGPSAFLTGTSAVSTDSRVSLAVDKLATGSGSYAWLLGRRVGTSGEYGAKVNIASSGAVRLDVSRRVNGAEASLAGGVIPGLQYSLGDQLQIRVQVSGTSPTTVSVKVWETGTAEPGTWQFTANDSTSALQTAGSIGLATYVSGSAGNGPIALRFDNLSAQSLP